MNPIKSGNKINHLVSINKSTETLSTDSPLRNKPTHCVSREKIHYVTDRPNPKVLEDSVNEMLGEYAVLAFSANDSQTLNSTYAFVDPSKKENLQGVLTSSSSSSSEGTESTIRFKKRLARGGFGAVWLAKLKKSDSKDSFSEESTSKKVAVKEFFEVDDRELAIVTSLIQNKPSGVPRLYGVMTGNHLVMKYCNNGTAANFLSGVSNPKAGYQKLAAILESIDKFHHAGYCHRDIHEGNFMLHQSKSGKDTIYLTDFGHAGNLKSHDNNLPPIGSRPMFFSNSPVQIDALFQKCTQKGNFTAYNKYLEKNGKKIDLYQAGMMIFRFATADNGAIIAGGQNRKQKNLVMHLMEMQEVQSASNSRDQLRAKAGDYLKTHHPEIGKEVREVITKLLFPSSKTSLKKIGKTLIKAT